MVPEDRSSEKGAGSRAEVARHRAAVQQELSKLEAECRQRRVKLIYDDLRGEGGLCRVRSEFYVIVNRRLSAERRIMLIRSCLAKLDADRLSVQAVREAAVYGQQSELKPSPEEPTAIPAGSSLHPRG